MDPETSPPAAEVLANNAALAARPAQLNEHQQGPPSETAAPADGEAEPEIRTDFPRQAQFIESGKINYEVLSDPDIRARMAERIIKRVQTAQELKGEERSQSEVDRIILSLGKDAAKRIDSGEMTREDLALAWYVIHDEILLKSLAIAKQVRDTKEPARRQWARNIPLLRRFAQDTTLRLWTQDRDIQLGSEYSRELGFDQWNPSSAQRHLEDLNDLRTDIEMALFEQGLEDPLFDEISTSITPLDFAGKTRNRLHDMVVSELTSPEGVLTQRFQGRSLLDLQRENPVAAMQALHEANQRALTRFAGESAQNFLKAAKPEVDTTVIDARIAEKQKRAKPEELKELEEKRDSARVVREDAEKTLSTLKEQLQKVQDELPDAIKRYEELQGSWDSMNTGDQLKNDITYWEAKVNDLNAKLMSGGIVTLGGGGMSPEQLQIISANLAKSQEILHAKQAQRDQLLRELGAAKKAKENLESRKTNLETGIATAATEVEAKKTGHKDAEKELATKQKEGTAGLPKETQDEVKALGGWKMVVDNYKKIIDTRFSQQHGGEYTRENLADITERADGQIEGAERIREHILYVVDKAGYDPVLARQMLSDGDIAMGIIWVMKIDSSQLKDTHGISLTRRLTTTRRSIGALDPTSPTYEADKNALELAEKATATELLKQVLPRLRASQFQVGDLARFLAHEGAKSAERGNPYLRLSDRYLHPEAELKAGPETILKKDVGRMEIRNRTFTWDGQITGFMVDPAMGPLASREYGNPVPLNIRVAHTIDRDRVNYSIDIVVDQEFLETLPETAPPVPPPGVPDTTFNQQIRRIFYDANGQLRMELRGRNLAEIWNIYSRDVKMPRTIRVETDRFITPGGNVEVDFLNHLQTSHFAELPDRLYAATVNAILNLSAEARTQVLRVLPTQIPIVGVPFTDRPGLPATTRDLQISFDPSYDILITDSTTGQTHKLSEHYLGRMEEYRRALGVQTLSSAQRDNIQAEFLEIQRTLGQSILLAQQRR